MGQILATGKKPKWKDFAWEERKTSCSIWETGISFPNNTIRRSCSNEDEVFPSCACCGTAMRCNYFWFNTLTPAGCQQLPLCFLCEKSCQKAELHHGEEHAEPLTQQKKILFQWGILCSIGDGDRAGYSLAERSRTQVLSKGSNAEIGNTNPAWMPT